MSTPPYVPPSTASLEIDTFPVLYALLTRLQPPTTSSTTGTSASPPSVPTPTPSSTNLSTSQAILSGTGPLKTKDIPIAADGIKHKLQKARMEVKQLPDIERGIREQEEEIRELEQRIKKQKEVLRGLAQGDIKGGKL